MDLDDNFDDENKYNMDNDPLWLKICVYIIVAAIVTTPAACIIKYGIIDKYF